MPFSLASVVQNNFNKPPLIVLHGDAGVGKTTFGSTAPNCIFIRAEDGLGILDVPTFPEPKDADEVTQQMNVLLNENHNYQWLIIDSITALEKKLWAQLCKKSHSTSIEDVGGGYGKGFTQSLEWTNQFINDMRKLRDTRGMGIILIAHSKISTINPPDKSSYDQYTLNVQPKLADFIHTQADIVAYCELEQLIKQEDKGFNQTQGKVKETGKRVLHCYSSKKYTSKNRYGIQSEIPMDFNILMQHISANMPRNQNQNQNQ